jgi:hypothetical protein
MLGTGHENPLLLPPPPPSPTLSLLMGSDDVGHVGAIESRPFHFRKLVLHRLVLRVELCRKGHVLPGRQPFELVTPFAGPVPAIEGVGVEASRRRGT